MDALNSALDGSVRGNGRVVGVVGPPGIGKSRGVREITSLARSSAVEVCATYCESHTTDVAFYAGSGLLRAALGAEGLEGAGARARVRERHSGAEPPDLLLP